MENNKKLVKLSDSELVDCIKLQKEFMESFGRNLHKYNKEKEFEIFSVAIAVVISNICVTFGEKGLKAYFDDLTKITLGMHEAIKKNSSYMEFKNGIKISEGQFN